MKRITIYCDRCGRELKELEQFEVRDWHEHQKKVHNSTITSYDLCKECYKEFADFMKNK